MVLSHQNLFKMILPKNRFKKILKIKNQIYKKIKKIKMLQLLNYHKFQLLNFQILKNNNS